MKISLQTIPKRHWLFLFSLAASLFFVPINSRGDAIDDDVQQLSSILVSGITSSNQADGVVVIRKIEAAATQDYTQCLKTITILVQATITPPANNQIAQEASIALATIGYQPDALAAYINILNTGANDNIKIAALQIVKAKTQSNPLILKDNGLNILLTTFTSEGAKGNTGLFQAVWSILNCSQLSTYTLSQRLQFIFGPYNSPVAGVVSPTVPYVGFSADSIQVILNSLTQAIADYKTMAARVGWQNSQLGPYVTRITNIVEFWIFQPISDPASIWNTIQSLPDPQRTAFQNQLLQALCDDLDIVKKGDNGAAAMYLYNIYTINASCDKLGKAGKILIPHLQPFLSSPISGTRTTTQNAINRLNSL